VSSCRGRYAECHLAKCCNAGLSVVMQGVVMLNVIRLSVVMLNVIMLSVAMLNVIRLSVVVQGSLC
jgi:hypothetical protein